VLALADSFLTVRVNLPHRGYEIRIGTGSLAFAGEYLNPHKQVSRAIVVTDVRVDQLHAQPVARSLTASGANVNVLVVESGEKSKCIAEADRLWQQLLALGADRKTLLVAVGGGVVGDLAGFVAATYARGIPFVQVPTTLLAQVDSSVGGKVGVNLPQAKNMVGAFWQPAAVLIDTQTLQTLPEREYRSGLAEVVKYGVIMDADFFAKLESETSALEHRQHDVLQTVIARCCRLKADVVEADEREETGRRAILNYGHTFAHAFEAVAGYGQLLHGEAVSIGMMCAARLAERLKMIDAEFVRRQRGLLIALGLPVATPELDEDKLINAMAHDKKAANGKLRFILPTELGAVKMVEGVDLNDVRAALSG
jgi:3-dehydroquinate synthase